VPDITYELNLQQGFNFRQDVQDICGFVTSLSIAQKTSTKNGVLKPDIAASNPNTDGVTSPQNVVGVMKAFKWGGGLTDPIELKFNVSNDNRNVLFGLLQSKLSSTDIAISFQVFNFDQPSAQFYLAIGAAATNGVAGNQLTGNIAKEGKEKLLFALPNNSPAQEVQMPQNWDVELTIAPAQLAQSVMYQYAPAFSMIKSWGITVT